VVERASARLVADGQGPVVVKLFLRAAYPGEIEQRDPKVRLPPVLADDAILRVDKLV